MHRRCNDQKVLFTACTDGARTKKWFLRFAPVVQELKRSFFRLQRWCKGQKAVLSVCTGGARGKKRFLGFAPPVQAFPKTFWPWRGFHRNSLLTLFLRRTHVEEMSWKSLWQVISSRKSHFELTRFEGKRRSVRGEVRGKCASRF